MYLVITDTIVIDNKVFYSGVSWEDYRINEDGTYTITDNEISYTIPAISAIQTNRFTRSENISAIQYRYKKSAPFISDYVKIIKKAYNIDISKNNIPQFRDGVNPLKDVWKE